MAKDDPSLLRQWNLIRTLSARRRGLTVNEMVQETEVAEKTIRRDLELFQQIGLPISAEVESRGRKRWKIDVDWNGQDPHFAFDEILALYLGRRFLEPLAGTFFWQAAQRAIQKIRASLNEETLRYLDRMSGQFYQTSAGAGDYSDKYAVIDDLWRGITKRRAVFITYRSQRSTEALSYDVHPYGIVYHRGSLYLVGFSCQHDEIRHWKVDRVENADATGVPFELAKGFDLNGHMSESFGVYSGRKLVTVKVRFSAKAARYVSESRWHPSQKLSAESDGSLVAEFRLSDTEEIKHWILSFGAEAEVLAPRALRADLASEFKRLLKTYECRMVAGE